MVTIHVIPLRVVIPAKAGIQRMPKTGSSKLDSRFRGNDLNSHEE